MKVGNIIILILIALGCSDNLTGSHNKSKKLSFARIKARFQRPKTTPKIPYTANKNLAIENKVDITWEEIVDKLPSYIPIIYHYAAPLKFVTFRLNELANKEILCPQNAQLWKDLYDIFRQKHNQIPTARARPSKKDLSITDKENNITIKKIYHYYTTPPAGTLLEMILAIDPWLERVIGVFSEAGRYALSIPALDENYVSSEFALELLRQYVLAESKKFKISAGGDYLLFPNENPPSKKDDENIYFHEVMKKLEVGDGRHKYTKTEDAFYGGGWQNYVSVDTLFEKFPFLKKASQSLPPTTAATTSTTTGVTTTTTRATES